MIEGLFVSKIAAFGIHTMYIYSLYAKYGSHNDNTPMKISIDS